MFVPYPFPFKNQHLWLVAEKCIFWEEEGALILSDTHIGKTAHFKANGIAVPEAIFKDDLRRLWQVISVFNPKKILIVGDLLHKKNNQEVAHFIKWKNETTKVPFHLIKGNHDVLSEEWYNNAGIILHQQQLLLPPFLFIHDPNEIEINEEEDIYTISGHIHPGVRLKITGKQHIKLPCFYFGKHQAILPAFSNFTGLAMLKPTKKDKVFAIANQNIIEIK
jgi:DNA ligase-associated metallophosphoesterase